MTNNPLVSVIIPCYNQGNYLAETLKSVFTQTYELWECFIVDDGSTDNTKEVALDWCQKDSRYNYIEKKNGGVASARNAGLSQFKGQYIQILDGDDLIEKDKFYDSLKAFDKLKIHIVFSNYIYLKEGIRFLPARPIDTTCLNYESYLSSFGKKFVTPIHTAIFDAKCLEDYRFDETLSFSEDWIMWLSIFKKHPKCFLIDAPHAIYRLHNSSSTSNPQTVRRKALEIRQKLYGQLEEKDRTILFHSMTSEYYQTIEEILQSKTYKAGEIVKKVLAIFSPLNRRKSKINRL